MTVTISKQDPRVQSMESPAAARDQLGYLAMLARPFTLQHEPTYFKNTEGQQVMSQQLLRMWEAVPTARMHMYAARAGHDLLPGGISDREVGDRVLYSQLVHADDASQVLDHIDTPTQLWSLAGMVGDWVAIIAHQQHVLRMVRPDLCPELVQWPGSPRTVFERFGAEVQDRHESTPDGT